MAKGQFKLLLFLFSLILFFNANLVAQDSIYKAKLPVYLRSSFFYDFPQSFGAMAGIDFPVKSKVIAIPGKNGKNVLKYRDLIVSSEIGFYRYPFNNTGLYLFQSIGKRYYKRKPYYFEWLASIGILRTFYDGIVYTVDNSGNVHVKNNFGRYYALTGFATVFGHDFERSKNPLPFAIEIKPSLWFQYPYNSIVLPHISAEISFKYHFKSFNTFLRQKYTVQSLSK